MKDSNTGNWNQSCNSDGSCNAPYQCVGGFGGENICCIDQHANQPLSGGSMCCAAASTPTACAKALCSSVQCEGACYNGVCCDTYQEGCDGAPCGSGGTYTNGVCCSSFDPYCAATKGCCMGRCCGAGTNLCCPWGKTCAPDGEAICGEKCGDGSFCPGDTRCCGRHGYYQCYDPDNCICYEGRPACG